MDATKIYRGCYATQPESLVKTNKIIIKGKMNALFKGVLKPKMQIHVTAAMPTVPGIIYPYKFQENRNTLLEEVHPEEGFQAQIILNEHVALESGDPIIISRLDLPPTMLRIVASGEVIDPMPDRLDFFREQTKVGKIRIPNHKRGSIVDGLVQTREGAQKMIGAKVISENGIEGKILSSFGTKSALVIKFDRTPEEGERVFLKRFRMVKI